MKAILIPEGDEVPVGTRIYISPGVVKERYELIKAAENVSKAFNENASRNPVMYVLLRAIRDLDAAVLAEKDALIKNHTAKTDIKNDA